MRHGQKNESENNEPEKGWASGFIRNHIAGLQLFIDTAYAYGNLYDSLCDLYIPPLLLYSCRIFKNKMGKLKALILYKLSLLCMHAI